MKLAILVALVAFSTPACVAQTERLECGNVELRLGEPEKEATKALTNAGYTPLNIDSQRQFQLHHFYNRSAKDSCDVAFNKGSLTYAARRWEKNITSELDAMRNVVAAVQSIAPVNEHNSCEVFSFQRSYPTHEMRSVSIVCAGRTVELLSGTMDGNPMYDITESIGVFPH